MTTPDQDSLDVPRPGLVDWRDDFVCYCRRQLEWCWPHPHRYDEPGADLGAIACQPHGHHGRSESPTGASRDGLDAARDTVPDRSLDVVEARQSARFQVHIDQQLNGGLCKPGDDHRDHDGAPCVRIVDIVERALDAARRPAPALLEALREAIGTSDASSGLTHWHTASGGTDGLNNRAGVYVDRQQVLDAIEKVLR